MADSGEKDSESGRGGRELVVRIVRVGGSKVGVVTVVGERGFHFFFNSQIGVPPGRMSKTHENFGLLFLDF